MDKYNEDPIACLSLIDSIFKYTIMSHDIINTLVWDIQVNDLYEHERQKVIKETDYLIQEHEHRCLIILNSIGKYWERLHKQVFMKKKLGLLTDTVNVSSSDNVIPGSITTVLKTVVSDVGSLIPDENALESVIINGREFDDEYDDKFAGLDNEIIPGYEPTPIPLFQIGGFKIPETFGMFRKTRGRSKNYNPGSTSFVENYRFLTTYTETPEDKLDRERDEQLKRELEASKKGKTIRSVTLKVVPIKSFSPIPTAINVPIVPIATSCKKRKSKGKVDNNSSSTVVPEYVRNLDSTAQKVWEVMNAGKQLLHKKLDPLGSSVRPKSSPVPIFNSSVSTSTSVSSSKSSVKSPKTSKSSKSSTAKQGGGRPLGSPNKPKNVPVLIGNFTPRLKSISSPSEPTVKCVGRPLGSPNKPKIDKSESTVTITPNTNFVPPPLVNAYAATIALHPLYQEERAIKYPHMKLPPKMVSPHVVINSKGEIVDTVGIKEENVDDGPKKRGRKLGSGNKGPTKESNENAIIHNKEIIFSDIPTNFEKYLIQFSRKNRDISQSEWEHHAYKALNNLKEIFAKMLKEYLADWEKKNREIIDDCKMYLMMEIKSGRLIAEKAAGTNYSYGEFTEDDIVEPYVPSYMDETYNNRDLDFTIRDTENYIIRERNKPVESASKYEEENNNIIHKVRKQMISGLFNSSGDGNIIIDRKSKRKSRIVTVENNVDDNFVEDILKALNPRHSSASSKSESKSEYEYESINMSDTSNNVNNVHLTMSVGDISDVQVEELMDELIAESCDNKDIYNEVFGESDVDSSDGSTHRRHIYDEFIGVIDNHSESDSDINSSHVPDIPCLSPSVSTAVDNVSSISEDDNVSESIVDHDTVNHEVDDNNSDVIQLVGDNLDVDQFSDITNHDVDQLEDIPYYEDISGFDSNSDLNIHDDVVDVIEVSNVNSNDVNMVDIVGTSDTNTNANGSDRVASETFTINGIVIPRMNLFDDGLNVNNVDYLDDDESEQTVTDDDRSDSDEEDVRRESNRNMFNFFFNELNIIENNGIRHRENIQHIDEDVNNDRYEEEEEETYDSSPTVNVGCGYSSYQDFLNDNCVGENVVDKEEDKHIVKSVPIINTGCGYSSYKDFLNDGLDIPVKTETVYVPKNENAEMFDSIMKELYG